MFRSKRISGGETVRMSNFKRVSSAEAYKMPSSKRISTAETHTLKPTLRERLRELEQADELNNAGKNEKHRRKHRHADGHNPEKYGSKENEYGIENKYEKRRIRGSKSFKTKFKEGNELKCPSVVDKYEELEQIEEEKDKQKYSLKSRTLLEFGKGDKRPSDPLAGIYEQDTIYMTRFLKRIKEQCELLDKLMNCIRYIGLTMKYIFEGLVDVATKRIVYVSKECQSDELAFNEILNFEALYRRLKRACKDFLQIFVEEYRENSKHQINICQRFAIELDEIYIDQNVPECYACINNFINFLEKEDGKILESKGDLWDDKPKATKWKLRNFYEKQEWIMGVIVEVLDDIKKRYFSEWISPEAEQLNGLIEKFKKKCYEKILGIQCQKKEISQTEIVRP